MTPREIVALALGTVIGAFMNGRKEPCRRACCMDAAARKRRKELWLGGQNFENAVPPARLFLSPDVGWTDPAPCASCATVLQDGKSLLWMAEYSRKFADQTLAELHSAALWIDSLLPRS